MPFTWSLVFFVLWSICLSSSPVHFKKGPEYLTRGTAQVFILLVGFLLDSFVSIIIIIIIIIIICYLYTYFIIIIIIYIDYYLYTYYYYYY